MKFNYKFDTMRWHFFANNFIGKKFTRFADFLFAKFPQNKFALKFWLFCLPF